ncbi:MAG: hypothetical protein S4CHLAM7_11230 [Chlamydiae bacterium]|nr:hypothetical protein [Chlamydiota bacterium]
MVALFGPRQCGKTTLARKYIKEKGLFPSENYFDLEDYADIKRLSNPRLALAKLKGLVVIDEVQRMPDLFMSLRVLVDEEESDKQFLILGSASRELLRQSPESLTGRIIYLELTPFMLSEVDSEQRLWERGGFPLSYLAEDPEDSYIWRKSYIRNFLEYDIGALDLKADPLQLRRFWMMLTHYHGNIYNGMEVSRSLNMSYNKVRSYVDILTSTLMIRQLQPWHANISKRQVKSYKIYFRDSGLFHTLLGINKKADLLTHAKLGASWEGFAIEEVIRYHQAEPYECYFWATQSHAELDLLIVRNGQKLGFEFKYTDAPSLTKSMKIAMEDLKLDSLTVIYPGSKPYALDEKIKVEGLGAHVNYFKT